MPMSDDPPERVRTAAARWQLRLGESLAGGTSSVVYACRNTEGLDLVLKLPAGRLDPSRVTAAETAALAAWNGSGVTPRLVASSPGALLLVRSRPGTLMPSLTEATSAELIRAVAGILDRLWAVDPGPFPFPDQAEVYPNDERVARADAAHERRERGEPERGEPGLRSLPAAALSAESLIASRPEATLLHGDLITKNLISDRRSRYGWTAIDPLPYWGDRAAEVAAFAAYQPAAMIMPGAEALAVATGVDPDRALRWAAVWLVHQIAQAWRDDQEELERLLRTPTVQRRLRA